MGGSEPPYLYGPQQSRKIAYPYSDFNPRAATQAAYQTLIDQSQPKPKREGPLINFNQHPDSHMVVPGTRTHHEPMPANTKKKVTVLRWIQFSLRLVTEVGALGLLVATICVTGTAGALTYLFRIPPAWDFLITLYAIYHLVRPARSRTPGSSASYHMFACFMDVGLCPLYAYIALVAQQNYVMPADSEDRLSSFFTAPGATNTLLFAIFAGAIGIGGLHLTSAFLDLWLIILFRKISNLPPDMNPLEDNLTGRVPRLKHKYKNSEYTLTSTSTDSVDEKKLAHLSTSTVDAPIVPFGHSRLDSSNDFSPHNPDSARWSRQQYGQVPTLYDEDTGSGSRWEINPEKRRAQGSRDGMSITGSQPAPTATSSHLDSFLGQDSGRPEAYRNARRAMEGQSPVRNQEHKQDLLYDAWYTNTGTTAQNDTEGGRDISRRDYAALHARHDSFQPNGGVQQPLKMNPPTPPLPEQAYPDPADDGSDAATLKADEGLDRSGTVISHLTTSSVYSESAPEASAKPKGTPKTRYYGDLAAATMGVRGGRSDRNAVPGLGAYGVPSPQPSRSPSPPKRDTPGRVVSRTGADITDADLYGPDTSQGFGMRNRRDVSGKIAEEGRGGVTENGTWAGGRLFR